ncbi:Flp family type IVb pilin [Cystobacter fuscus]|uniref:Flp family type IVb pilin n=1 Tax=Cystobacter fuscus TaxID=43 RepID=UPI0037BF090C
MNARLTPPSQSSAPWRRRGHSLTEYALITFLVALGTIGVVGLFGDNLRHLFGTSSESLAGASNGQNGGSAPSTDLSKWSIKGSGSNTGNPGGSSNSGGSDTND